MKWSIKMDAADNDTWQKVNRPDMGLDFEKTMESINHFADEYNGKLCTETMLIDGINDTVNNITNVSEIIKSLNPATAYLAIPLRPSSEKSVNPPDSEKLNIAWQIFDKNHINTKFLTQFEGTDTGYTCNIYEDILNITAVHPLREDSLLKLLVKDSAGYSVVNSMVSQHLIKSVTYGGNKYFIRVFHTTD